MGVLQGEVGLDPFDLDQELLPDNLDLVKPDEIIQLGRTDLDRVDDIETHEEEEDRVGGKPEDDLLFHKVLMFVDPVHHE